MLTFGIFIFRRNPIMKYTLCPLQTLRKFCNSIKYLINTVHEESKTLFIPPFYICPHPVSFDCAESKAVVRLNRRHCERQNRSEIRCGCGGRQLFETGTSRKPGSLLRSEEHTS